MSETRSHGLTERARLEAGGLVRVGASVGSDLATDHVDARGYSSPALPGRVVVRLVPDAIARGIDTEMELLGFGMTHHADDIATQRRRALGFPGTALVIDPEHARYALDVMREFKKHAKRIGSKPGHARDGFDEIGVRLSRQVPHFLPSYYEEVARAFAVAGNLTYAGTFFDKGRTAEREFGLVVDEERRAEAFLEFALLGALTVKSIQAYGKEVQRLAGADKGYERLYQLATRRTLGGVAPWASLPKDLRTLAKAAGRSAATEDARFLTEVSTASALKRAPGSFWTEYADAWTALAKADPAIRGRLLDLFPNGGKTRYAWRNDKSGFTAEWGELLGRCGALDALWTEVEPAARPNAGRAGWLLALQGWCGQGQGLPLQIVRRAAPQLIADGVPVPVAAGGWYQPLDLDLVDLLTELGVPWKFEVGHQKVDLATWASWKPAPAAMGLPAEHRPRDPVFAVRSTEVVDRLRPTLDGVFGNAEFEATAAGMEGLRELRSAWLTARLHELGGPGLAATEHALDRLEAATSADHFVEFPEAATLLSASLAGSVARSLAATLRDGILEELHWPAWTEAQAWLGVDEHTPDHAVLQWPYLLWFTASKLVVVDQDKILLRHELKHGDGKSLPMAVYFVGGKVLVAWRYWKKAGNVQIAYWSHAPNDPFDHTLGWRGFGGSPIEHGDSIVVGTDRLTVGDRAFPEVALQVHDRDTSWVMVDGKWRVQDRATGKPGPEASPGFLRGAQGTAYFVVPGNAAHTSPVAGVVDGQYGFRLLRARSPEDEDEDAVDGSSEAGFVTTLAGDRFPSMMQDGSTDTLVHQLVRLPGRAALRGVAVNSRWRPGRRVNRLVLSEPGGTRISLAAEVGVTGSLPPLQAWHYLRPRHAGSSAALAALTDEQAAQLLATDPAGAAPGTLLPGVTEPGVHAGLVAAVTSARAFSARLEKLAAARATGGVVRARPAPPITDEALAPALSNFGTAYHWGKGSVSLAIETLGRFLRDGETGENVAFSRHQIETWIGRIRGLAISAARPGLAADSRKLLVDAVRLFAASGLAGPAVRTGTLSFSDKSLAWVTLVPDDDDPKLQVPAQAWRHHDGAHRLLVTNVSSEAEDDGPEGPWKGSFVQHATDGVLPTPKGATLSALHGTDDADVEWIDGFLGELAARGAFAVTRDEVDRMAAAVGITPTDAAIVLAGFPQEFDKDLRESLGLKHADVKAACERLRSTPFADKATLLAARGGADPASVWGADAVERIVAAWSRRFGTRIAVDEALLAAADKELGRGGAAGVTLIANHRQSKTLTQDQTYALSETGDPQVGGAAEAFDAGTAQLVARSVCWLAARLPVGHPVRDELPAVLDAARARLAHPGLWLSAGYWLHYDDKAKKVAQSWFDALPGRSVEVSKDDEGAAVTWRKDVGAVVVTRSEYWTRVSVRHASLDESARELLQALQKMGEHSVDALLPAEVLCSAGLTAIADRIRTPALEAGTWEQNPMRSAPDVVRAVVKSKKLSENAAAAWLQLLALPEPSKKAVCEWNGWSPKVYDTALAELAAASLVVVGKRARAGREHFLPGGWEDSKAGPPYESWKLESYGASDGAFPLGVMVPLVPLHQLFAKCWARCEGGDAPAFEEVRR